MNPSVLSRLLVATAALVLASGCVDVDVPESLSEPAPTTEAPDTPGAPTTGGESCVSSLRPDGPASQDVASGSYMGEIQEREELRVGVDVGTPGFSSANVSTGDPEGFDVDIAKEVAGALFGNPDAVELIPIASGERVEALTEGRVDLVAHNFTINCERWDEIAFSSEYFTAGQRILVRDDDSPESPENLEDLADSRVCATSGSTALSHIEEAGGLPVAVPDRTDCLVLLQQGQVDALATDDAILAGLADQDPGLEIRGDVFSEEPYGLGLPPDEDEWVRYVNAVLEDVRDSGRWNELADKWLGDTLEGADNPPAPSYSD